MLTLFTYADIDAVHPDALTPWKAENLWRLYLATANYLDRSVDDERVGVHPGDRLRQLELVPSMAETTLEALNEQKFLEEEDPLFDSLDVAKNHLEVDARLKSGTEDQRGGAGKTASEEEENRSNTLDHFSVEDLDSFGRRGEVSSFDEIPQAQECVS